MALESVMLQASAETKNAIVRLYNFPKDAIIFGYAQASDAIKLYDGTFDTERRITGGSHVQVGPNVLCYSIAVPRNGQFTGYEDMRGYYHQCIAEGLTDLGIDGVDVNNKASTINVNGKVVASGAIHWGRQSGLLHGLIIMDPYDMNILGRRVHLAQRRIGGEVYTEHSAISNIPAVSQLLKLTGVDLPQERRLDIMKQMVGHAILRRITGNRYAERPINARIEHNAMQFIREKYGNESWTLRRAPPFTADNVEAIPGEELNGYLRKTLGYCLFSQVDDSDFKKMATPSE